MQSNMEKFKYGLKIFIRGSLAFFCLLISVSYKLDHEYLLFVVWVTLGGVILVPGDGAKKNWRVYKWIFVIALFVIAIVMGLALEK